MLSKKVLIYKTVNQLNLETSLYRHTSEESNGVILYFHGGGLIWGDRDDLPEPYIEDYCLAGFDVLTFDYRLAPETPLPILYTDIQAAVLWFQHNYEKFNLPNHFAIMGRSAGAYLGYLATADVTLPKPFAFISFYGYHRIDLPFYTAPNPAYFKYPFLSQIALQEMVGSHEIKSAPIEKRYGIYLNDRKTGTWLNRVLPQENPADFSLSDEQLAQFPPAFLAHSTTDKDVPYELSQMNAKLIPNSQLYTVKDMPHDFDANLQKEAGLQAHHSAIDFLFKTTKSGMLN